MLARTRSTYRTRATRADSTPATATPPLASVRGAAAAGRWRAGLRLEARLQEGGTVTPGKIHLALMSIWALVRPLLGMLQPLGPPTG